MFTFSLHTMDSDNKPTETLPTDEKKQGKKRNYRKDKPWDDGTVNKWEIDGLDPRNGKRNICPLLCWRKARSPPCSPATESNISVKCGRWLQKN